MKKIFILLLFIVCNCSAYSQQIDIKYGVNLGLNACQIDGDEQYGYQKAGLSAGLSTLFFSDKTLTFEIGVQYNNCGSVQKDDSQVLWKIKLNCIDIPTMVMYNKWEHFKIGMGYSFGTIFKATLVDEFKGKSDAEYISKFDNKIHIGMDYKVNEHFTAKINFGYSLFSFAKQIDTAPNYYNNIIRFGAAWYF